MLKRVIRLDGAASEDHMMEIAKLLSVWQAASTRDTVEVYHNANRTVDHLPSRFTERDLTKARNALGKALALRGLPEFLQPSRPYFERKCGEAESYWTSECLTAVTNCAQAEGNEKASLDFEQRSGTSKLCQRAFGVPLPAGSEAFRNRITALAICYGYTEMRYPQNSRLGSCSM